MSDNRYFRLKVTGLARENEDEFTDFCFENGAEGVAEDLKFVQQDLVYEPDVIETPIMDANVYFSNRPDENFLLQLQARFPESGFEMVTEENRDWMEEWKKGFKPFVFAGPFWIVPSWFETPPEAAKDPSKVLFVDPGMAFGTGTHETTRLAGLYVIEECERSHPQSMIDVGTGTAVLALVARRLGATKVVGIDNDPEARRVARENLAHNNATDIEVPDLNIEDIKETYDLVVANIIDGVLTLLRHELKRVMKPGGRLVLSGILTEREEAFYENFIRETGLKMVKRTRDGEWAAAILEKV